MASTLKVGITKVFISLGFVKSLMFTLEGSVRFSVKPPLSRSRANPFTK